MPTLHIDLRDGFKEDEVIIYLRDQEVARRSGVTTDLTISHAASLEVPAPSGPSTLRIDIPKQHVSFSESVDPVETPFVAIFIRNRQITFQKLKEAMPML